MGEEIRAFSLLYPFIGHCCNLHSVPKKHTRAATSHTRGASTPFSSSTDSWSRRDQHLIALASRLLEFWSPVHALHSRRDYGSSRREWPSFLTSNHDQASLFMRYSRHEQSCSRRESSLDLQGFSSILHSRT